MSFSKFSALLFLLNNVAVVSGSANFLRRTQEVKASPRNSEFCPETQEPKFGDACRKEGINCAYRPVSCKGEKFYVTQCSCSQSIDYVITDRGSEFEFQCFTMAMSADCIEGEESDSPDIQIEPPKPKPPINEPKPPADKPPKKECPPSPPFGIDMRCSVDTPTPCEYNPFQCVGEDIVRHDTHCYCEGGKFHCVQSRPYCENGVVTSCSKEMKLCPDGTPVGRDSQNNCEFKPCPDGGKPDKPKEEPKYCPKDLRRCSDDSMVGRNPENGCQFEPCPDGGKPDKPKQDPTNCPQDMKTCPDGFMVGRDPKNGCEYKPCSDDTGGRDINGSYCPSDTRKCGDGTYMQRDPNNGCKFPLCADESRECPKSPPKSGLDKCAPSSIPLICNYDKRKCPEETTYSYLTKCECGKDGIFYCAILDLLCERQSCLEDMLECPDGSILRPGPDCLFPECPTVDDNEIDDDDEAMMCPEDMIQCPNGSWVGRDEDNKCTFHPCPEPNCIECSDNFLKRLVEKGKTCAKFNSRQLEKKCKKKQWEKREFCQYSCFEAGFGYGDKMCCAKKEE